jgi:hypothetical protein
MTSRKSTAQLRTITIRRLALAAVVVLLAPLGADTVAFAATGHSLVAGKLNSSGETTVVKNTGKGPALVLKSKGRSPSLGVSSERLVRRLNADRLDGRHAEDLAPLTHQLTIMQPGETLTDARFFNVSLPAGDYLITFNGVFSGSGTKYCVLGDAQRIRKDKPEAVLADQTEAFRIGGSTVATLDGQSLVVGCNAFDTDHELTAVTPVTVSFRELTGIQPLLTTPATDPLDETGARAGRGLAGR